MNILTNQDPENTVIKISHYQLQRPTCYTSLPLLQLQSLGLLIGLLSNLVIQRLPKYGHNHKDIKHQHGIKFSKQIGSHRKINK